MKPVLKPIVLAVAALAVQPAFAGVILFPNSDFEAGTLSNWTAVGTAFTRQPTFGDNTTARENVASLHQGNYWIGTFENYDGITGNPGDTRGDGATGTLTSQEFTISKRYITFLAGGGNLPGQTGIKLLCEGQEYAMGTGFDSESMFPVTFDAAVLTGKLVRVVIFDQATGGWGTSMPTISPPVTSPLQPVTAGSDSLPASPPRILQALATTRRRVRRSISPRAGTGSTTLTAWSSTAGITICFSNTIRWAPAEETRSGATLSAPTCSTGGRSTMRCFPIRWMAAMA